MSGLATGAAWPLKIYGLILEAHFKLAEQRTALLVVQTAESLVTLALLLLGLGVVEIRIGTAVSTALLTFLLFRRAAKRVMPSPPIRPWRANLKTLREMSGFTSGVFVARLLQTVVQRVELASRLGRSRLVGGSDRVRRGGWGLLVLTAPAARFGKPERKLALELLATGRLRIPDPIVRWLER